MSRAQHNHFPLGSGGRQPAGSLLPSSACSQSWPSVCSELPACPVQGAQPGQVLALGGRGVNLYPPVPLRFLQPQRGLEGMETPAYPRVLGAGGAAGSPRPQESLGRCTSLSTRTRIPFSPGSGGSQASQEHPAPRPHLQAMDEATEPPHCQRGKANVCFI